MIVKNDKPEDSHPIDDSHMDTDIRNPSHEFLYVPSIDNQEMAESTHEGPLDAQPLEDPSSPEIAGPSSPKIAGCDDLQIVLGATDAY